MQYSLLVLCAEKLAIWSCLKKYDLSQCICIM